MARTVDKGHGRVEVRTLRLTSVLTKGQDRAGLKQGFERTRERAVKGEKTVEVVHGITRLTREEADAGRLLGLVREHRQIENGSHDRRDVALGEDQRRVRKGSAPQGMAGLRSTVIHLAQDGGPTLAAAMRRLGNCFSRALTLLGLPLLK